MFLERSTQVERPSPNLITANDMDVIIKGWEEKFEHLTQHLRDIQLASEKANSTIYDMEREGRAREDLQERRIEEMHTGLTRFLERCDPRTSQHHTAPRHQHKARHSRPRERRPDCVTISTLNLLSPRIDRQILRATEITTTLGKRHAPAWTRAT